eukprot:1394619-Rhodomonas_salina.1
MAAPSTSFPAGKAAAKNALGYCSARCSGSASVSPSPRCARTDGSEPARLRVSLASTCGASPGIVQMTSLGLAGA